MSKLFHYAGGVYFGIRRNNSIYANGKLDDVEIAYYINKLRRISKGKELKRVTFILGDEYVDLRYLFKNYPFERIWRISTCNNSAAAI